MNEEKARAIIGGEHIKQDNTFTINDGNWTGYERSGGITLDGEYSVEYLEALVWWINNKKTIEELELRGK